MAFDATGFGRTLLYENSAPIREICADLQDISQFDRRQERLKAQWWVILFASLAVGILGTVGASQSAWISKSVPILWGACAAMLIVSIVQIVRYSMSDLANRRYELAREVLRLLEKDTAADGAVTLRLDLRPPHDSSKKVREGKQRDWNVVFFADKWLSLNGRFLDGTAYRLLAVERFQKRHKRARGRSGKMKFKSKTKTATQLSLLLKPKPKKYGELKQERMEIVKAVQLPAWSHLKTARRINDRLQIVATTKERWHGRPLHPENADVHSGPHLVAMMFLSLYQVLGRPQASAK